MEKIDRKPVLGNKMIQGRD